ncbi:hypothetical protein C1645_740603 [Glomus cerebriforme]|uniref:Galactose oxidase n=1 Tax=Glomus cerebriforme TaxID=658196 RepID=A0A397SPC2_9GLOM|nr:hypothetical protein C1645_740603 [Glomus cerebriforme]
MIPFKPLQRSFHTATLINDKLYIMGGKSIDSNLNEFFYLDTSVTFNIQNLPWVDLSNTITFPSSYGTASVKGGANNDTLFLFGGNTTNPNTPSLYMFDTQSHSWIVASLIVKNTGTEFRKSYLTGIIDNNRKMYLFGGYDGLKSLNDMFTIDTIKLIMGEVDMDSNAPTPRNNYGATLLPNNNIIYLGGYNVEAELQLDLVYIYNTMNNNWNMMIATGTVPSSRNSFSTILGLDGLNVIIFGGTTTFSAKSLEPEDSIYELNLSNFEWNIPKISNTSKIPSSRMYHKANVIGNYMVVSFGIGYDPLTESDILLLDISNKNEYAWTNTFVNSPPSTTTFVKSITTNTPKSTQLTNFIGLIIGSLIYVIIYYIKVN